MAILLMAYGTPEKESDIKAYYTDVRRGNPPDDVLLKELQDRYAAIGGTRPLLRITIEQAAALEKRLGQKVYIGMKHWHPYISEAVAQIKNDKVKEITALVLAPHFSTLSIGDYENRLQKAISDADANIKVNMIYGWGNNKYFIDSLCERIEETKKQFDNPSFDTIEVVFSAHSLPLKILAMGDPYKDELMQTATLAAKQLRLPHWRLSFQSAGRTRDTWLGPDILQELRTVAKTERKQVLDAPIGFVADNLEILYDLDIQAKQEADKLDLVFKRIPSANATPRFIDALFDVLRTRGSKNPPAN